MPKRAKPSSTFSIRLPTDELERFRALAAQHELSLNRWFLECVDRALRTWYEGAEVQVEQSDSKVQIDWQAIQALAGSLDRWHGAEIGTHSMQQALEWLANLAAPLAQEQLLLATRESKQALDNLEAFGRDFGLYMDKVRQHEAPHNGVQSLLDLARSLMRGELVIAGRDLLARLKSFENELRAIDTSNVSPISRAKKETH